MHPLFQRFDFSYANGEYFWDRSGQLAYELRKMMPGLRVKHSGADQRDMIDDAAQRELYFGIAAASISSSAVNDTEFISVATGFLRQLALIFEVQWLHGFTFRYIIGRRCTSPAEADALLWPLIGKEGQEKLKEVAPDGRPQAFQMEFRSGPVETTVRFAILDLAVNATAPGELQPHLCAMAEVRGTEPIAVAEFDAAAFMSNVSSRQMEEILRRIAPHLHESANPSS